MKTLIPALAAASLALAATFAFAQDTPGYGPGMMGRTGMGPGGGYGPGNQAHRERMRAAYEACKDKPDRFGCMTEQYCAKSADVAKCQAQAKEHQARMGQRMEQQQKMHEACNAKRGEDLTKCMRDQRLALRNQRLDERQKAHEACNGKRGDELRTCLGEQFKKSGGHWHGPRG